MGRRITGPVFFLALLAAAAAAGLGMQRGERAPGDRDRPRLIIVGVNGLSWDRILKLRSGDDLPHINGLLSGKCSYGEIIGEGHDTGFSVLASIISGRFPSKHNVTSESDIISSGRGKRLQTPVWDVLARRGQRCAVIGFPRGYERKDSVNRFIPAGSGGVAGRRRDKDPLDEISVVEVDNITDPYIKLAAGDRDMPPGYEDLLRECMSDDLNRLAQASDALADPRIVHSFVYFEGLGRWERIVRDGREDAAAGMMDELLDGYYRFIDRLMADLLEGKDDDAVTMIFSEEGSHCLKHPSVGCRQDMNVDTRTGFLYAAGQHVRRGQDFLMVKPVDLAPTLLYLAGNPVLNNMDGTVIVPMVEESHYFRNLIEYR